MNDRELEQLLKSAEPPAKPDEYWRDFPKRISAKLHWQPQATAPVRPRNVTSLAWAMGLAISCVVVYLVFRAPTTQPTLAIHTAPAKDEQLAAARKCYHEFESLFGNQLEAIVFDQKGPRMILSDKPNLPASTPLYVKACGPQGCVAFVTFSGQHVPFNGENCEVLSDAHDKVMLIGNRHVWTQSAPSDNVDIEAKLL